MWPAVYAGLSVGMALAWVPVFIKFFCAWRVRNNPISLAICGVIALLIYSNVVGGLVSLGTTASSSAMLFVRVFNAVALVNFYIAMKWANRKFPEARYGSTKKCS